MVDIQRMQLPLAACLAAMALVASVSSADTGPGPSQREAHREVPNDPYLPVSRDTQPRSPGQRFGSGSFFSVQVNVDDLGQNIVGDAANEPSLAVDPTNPDRMTIGWRQFDTIASDFRQAGYGYTTDAGLTWTFPGVIEPGVFRSDPVLDTDSEGRVYYNSLTIEGGDDYVCDVFRSDDGGMAWDGGSDAQGGDKQWMAIDKSGGIGDGHVYSSWNVFFTSCPPGFFTRSTNGSAYEECITIPDDPYWGTIAVAPDGKLYVGGSSGSTNDFTVARSSNARNAFGPSISWDVSTSVLLGGSIAFGAGPNPGGLLGQASIAVDPTSGPGTDIVYVLCSVNPPGSDPLDVRFARSTDGGSTWGASARVNDDVGNAYQWFGTMSVSPSGRIDAIWLDTRHDPGGFDSSLYYSFSTDSGVTWSVNERLSNAFDPHVGWPQQNKMGDYFQMISDDAGFSLAWAATFNGEQDVYFGRMQATTVAAGEGGGPTPMVLLQTHPNPFDRRSNIRYEVPRDAFVTLKVYDALGRLVTTLVSSEHAAGSYETELDGRDLAGGVYFYRLTAGKYRDAQKVLRLK